MTRNREEAIRRFRELKVLVLGDVMLDVYEYCSTARSKPIPSEKPGKRAYQASRPTKALGGAGNVATNLVALGVQTSLIGLTGNDGHYFTMQELADESGIAHCLIRDRSRPTTTKSRLYIDGEYLLRRDDEATHEVDRETAATIHSEFLRELDTADAVILSDYDKGFFSSESAQRIIRRCRDKGIPVVVDFKPPNRSYFTGATIIAPNDAEAAALLPGFGQSVPLEKGVAALYPQLGCDNLVVTLSERGLCGFDGSAFFHAPANRVQVTDAVGCGDTVRVGLTLGYTLGLSLREAAEIANDAAAVVIQKDGTATVSQEELLAFIRDKQVTLSPF